MSEVESRFQSNSLGTDEGASVLDVRMALESFGIKTRALNVRSHSVREIEAPAILFFSPGRWVARLASSLELTHIFGSLRRIL